MILIESNLSALSKGINKPRKIEQKQITQQKTIEPNIPPFLYKKFQSKSRISDKKVCKQIHTAELSILISSGKNIPRNLSFTKTKKQEKNENTKNRNPFW